jgi:hypothetical protein
MAKNFLSRRKKVFVRRFLPLLEKIATVENGEDMKKLVKKMTKSELTFFAECLYNILFNCESLFSIDQSIFVHQILKKPKVLPLLYQFTFQKCKKEKKMHICCELYGIFSVLISMLIPVFKIVME